MRLRLLGLSLAFSLISGSLSGSLAMADARGEQVVAKVGPVAITVADVERRLAAIPPFQLATFGKTPSEIRRHLVEQILVPEALLDAAAEARKLEEKDSVRAQVKGAMRMARLTTLRDETAEKGISEEEARAYYAANRDKFETPERISVFRILCKSQEVAKKVLAEAKKAGTKERWDELSREHSMDRATSMRGGDLGFLLPDGTSQHQGVKADVAIVNAAARVKDGEIVAEPIPEGEGFAVVWRRGSLPAVHRPVEREIESISQVLWRQKLEEARRELVSKLRGEKVRDVNPALIDLLEVDPQADLGLVKRPGVAPRPAEGSPTPAPGSKGELR